MQFLVTGYDGKDEGAIERRLSVRDEHMKLVDSMRKEGKHLYAAALLDENDKMIGSVIIVDFPTREDLNKWLKVEPYVVGDVWQSIEVTPCKVPPMFMNLHK
jgi:uncharacterized protein YciI